jgi:hypothetical protein
MSTNYNKRFKIKPTSVGELCNIYSVSYRILRIWLLPHEERIGKRLGYMYSAKQVEIIFEVLGLPKVIEDE